jgi:hypothetical protein
VVFFFSTLHFRTAKGDAAESLVNQGFQKKSDIPEKKSFFIETEK